MKRKLLYLFLIMIFNSAQAQEWVNYFGSTKAEYAKEIAKDQYNNVYVTGHFESDALLGPVIPNVTLTNNGGADVFLMKFDENGNLLWHKEFGGAKEDRESHLATDTDGNTYLSINFQDIISLTLKSGDKVEFTQNGNNGSSVLLLKIDKDGEILWVKQLGVKNVKLNRLIYDPNGNSISVVGVSNFEQFDIDPGNDIRLIGLSNQISSFIAKFSGVDCSLEWATPLYFKDSQMPLPYIAFTAIAIKNAGKNLVLTGQFSGDLVIPIDGKDSVYSNSNFGGNKLFIIDVNQANGEINNCYLFRGLSSSSEIKNLSVDKNNNLIAIGFWGYSNFDAGLIKGDTMVSIIPSNTYEHIVILKYDPDYKLFWSKVMGAQGQAYGYSVDVDNENNIFVGANLGYNNNVDIDPGPNVVMQNGGALVAKYTTDADLVWSKKLYASSTVIPYSIVADNNNGVFCAGLYQTEAYLNPSEPNKTTPFAGVFDGFVARYGFGITTDIKDSDHSQTDVISVYPNPVIDHVTISNNYEIVKVYDIQGRLLYKWNKEDYIDLGELNKGIYLLEVINNDQSLMTKIIKE
ncbi:MAG: T9SS type A sorting domain-containing protein [Sporocytophaga sp.]|nr:T9SS type A sorting domain-containing protein [Sporocytophaga sp.]